MRRIAIALLCSSTLAACTTDPLVQDLVADGWTEHAFRVPGEGVFRYACVPVGTDVNARAAQAHQSTYAGVIEIADRVTEDLLSGRIDATEVDAELERNIRALTAQVFEVTGCIFTSRP